MDVALVMNLAALKLCCKESSYAMCPSMKGARAHPPCHRQMSGREFLLLDGKLVCFLTAIK